MSYLNVENEEKRREREREMKKGNFAERCWSLYLDEASAGLANWEREKEREGGRGKKKDDVSGY